MEVLQLLEEKVNQLVMLTMELSGKNRDLQNSNEQLKALSEELKSDNAKFAEDNAQLIAQLRAIETSLESDNKQLHSLTEEKTLAKIVVDDLIKSIDALIEREAQQ